MINSSSHYLNRIVGKGVDILADGLYPESLRGKGRVLVNKRQHYKKKSESFYSKDGALYKTVAGSVKGVSVVKHGASDAIMTEFHSSAIGGHSGFNKTNSAIKLRYWWPKMTEDIRNYVKMCELCQKSDPMKPAKKPDLKPIHVTRPFELVGCDLMGPFHESESGFRYIFTATDYYTKWVEAFPIQTKSAKDVSACIKKLLYRHGAMNAILTDQGREFINEINKDLCTEWNIGHRVTAAYHPQTNGLDERTNQTIKRALSKCVNDSQTDWDVRLDQVLFSLRTKPQASTKYSPFFLLYGREAQYPSQLPASFGTRCVKENFPSCPTEDEIEECVEQRVHQETTTKENVQKNTDKAKAKQQKDFRKANEKKKRSYVEIKVGDKVLKFNSARAGRKAKGDLGANYSGPYIVMEIIGQRVKLQNLDMKVLKSLVSVNNIKLFKEQPDTECKSSNDEAESNKDPMANETTSSGQDSSVKTYIDSLVGSNSVEKVFEVCETLNLQTGSRPETLSSFSRKLPTCPVLSFINEETKTGEEQIDTMREAIMNVHKVTGEGDFAGTLLLTSVVLTKAYNEDVPPTDVLETLSNSPSFLSACPKSNSLSKDERLTVAGEGLEQNDINCLKGNNWLNDKVLNGYTKLLAREATDATDFSGSIKRMFMIPSYTATLWDAGIYDSYMFKKVDFSLYDLIVVPWNKNNNHWVVLVAHTKELTVSVYDSLNADNSHLIDKFCLFMNKRSKVVNDGLHQWDTVSPVTNKQADGSSYGVFVLMTLECLVNGKASWILRQVHVPMFRKYVMDRLLCKGIRNTYLCDSLTCKDPRGEVEWVMCDVCFRWLHKACSAKTVDEGEHYQCEICDAQYC